MGGAGQRVEERGEVLEMEWAWPEKVLVWEERLRVEGAWSRETGEVGVVKWRR